ncbi:MAG: polysaccharide biosynthesis protein, partial [Candidatus Nanopelagicales bacterium]
MRNLQWRWMLADTFAWLVGSVIAAELRFEFVASQFVLSRYVLVGLVCAALQISVGLLFGHYRGRFRSGTYDDFRSTCTNAAVASILGTVLVLLARPESIPRPVAITCGAIAVAIMLAARTIHRNLRERLIYSTDATTPVILFGAGDAGEQIARATRRDPHSNYEAVAFLDDAPNRQNLRLEGVDVRGTRFDLEKVAAATGARTLIVTIARANARLINDLSERCAAADIHMLVLPPVSQLVSGGVGLGDVREVNEADLLGRAVVQTDTASISDLIHGRRVLITGAGGSIGAEIARKVHPFGPSQMYLLDRDESALHAVQLSIHGRPNLSSDELILADIRDADRLDEIFADIKPEIVFHAAALKHLPLLERAPMEAVKSNIGGTQNVLAAAEKYGVDAFINISTDKAANPSSVLGFSKRI